MCIIAIKQKTVSYPSYQRVKNMCENNNDGFAMVWQAKDEPVHNYRTLNQQKFLKKYKWLTSAYKAKDVALFIHARIKTHGTQVLDNCHGWIEDSIGLAFAHNGILSIQNRGNMTDSETFFRDIFTPVFKIGGWDAGELAIKAIIGTSKFVFMDMYGNISHYGNYITGDDGILYSNDTYQEQTWRKYYNNYCSRYSYGYGSYYGGGYKSNYKDKYKETDKPSSAASSTNKNDLHDCQDYDDWYNSEEYLRDRMPF